MRRAVVIDAEAGHVSGLELGNEDVRTECCRALGSDDVQLGARLPDGAQIYLHPHALLTSQWYFRYWPASVPLPGRAVMVADRDLSPDLARHAVDFMTRDEALASLRSNAA